MNLMADSKITFNNITVISSTEITYCRRITDCNACTGCN